MAIYDSETQRLRRQNAALVSCLRDVISNVPPSSPGGASVERARDLLHDVDEENRRVEEIERRVYGE